MVLAAQIVTATLRLDSRGDDILVAPFRVLCVGLLDTWGRWLEQTSGPGTT